MLCAMGTVCLLDRGVRTSGWVCFHPVRTRRNSPFTQAEAGARHPPETGGGLPARRRGSGRLGALLCVQLSSAMLSSRRGLSRLLSAFSHVLLLLGGTLRQGLALFWKPEQPWPSNRVLCVSVGFLALASDFLWQRRGQATGVCLPATVYVRL